MRQSNGGLQAVAHGLAASLVSRCRAVVVHCRGCRRPWFCVPFQSKLYPALYRELERSGTVSLGNVSRVSTATGAAAAVPDGDDVMDSSAPALDGTAHRQASFRSGLGSRGHASTELHGDAHTATGVLSDGAMQGTTASLPGASGGAHRSRSTPQLPAPHSGRAVPLPNRPPRVLDSPAAGSGGGAASAAGAAASSAGAAGDSAKLPSLVASAASADPVDSSRPKSQQASLSQSQSLSSQVQHQSGQLPSQSQSQSLTQSQSLAASQTKKASTGPPDVMTSIIRGLGRVRRVDRRLARSQSRRIGEREAASLAALGVPGKTSSLAATLSAAAATAAAGSASALNASGGAEHLTSVFDDEPLASVRLHVGDDDGEHVFSDGDGFGSDGGGGGGGGGGGRVVNAPKYLHAHPIGLEGVPAEKRRVIMARVAKLAEEGPEELERLTPRSRLAVLCYKVSA